MQIAQENKMLNTKIQQQVSLINKLLLKAAEENLVVKISTPSNSIGRDGALGCVYYNEIEINLLVRL